MSLFSRAFNGASLTPAERGLLRLAKGCAVAGLVAVLPVIAQLLAAQNVDVAATMRYALAAFAVAVLLAFEKWLSAQKDSPLAVASVPLVADVAQAIETKAGVSDTVMSFNAPAPSAP